MRNEVWMNEVPAGGEVGINEVLARGKMASGLKAHGARMDVARAVAHTHKKERPRH
jgi:hypothetical protein